jgi:hypothetical protein
MTLVPSPKDRGSLFRISLSDLHFSLEDSLMVRHIAVPLETCGVNDDAKIVRKHMEEKHFDVMGVQEYGILRGYVRQKSLGTGKCGSQCKSFGPTDIIASTTSLVELLPLLRTRPYLFILDRTKVNGLVTRADLEKSPVRMLLFGIVSLLEMYLLSMVRICYPGESFRERLKPNRLAKAEGVLAARTDRDEDIDLADCLKLVDKYELLVQVPGLLEFFRLGEVRAALKDFKKMELLRDNLAHGQDLVTGTTWEELLGVAAKAEGFLRDCDERSEEFVRRFGRAPDSVAE